MRWAAALGASLGLAAWGVCLLAGCSPRAAPRAVRPGGPPAGRAARDTRTPPPGQCRWYVHTIADPAGGEPRRAGYRRITLRTEQRGGRTVWVDDVVDQLRVERFGQPVQLRIHAASRQWAAGPLIGFQYELKMGRTEQTVRGRVAGSKLCCELVSGGQTQQQATFPWSDQDGGFLAVERSLYARPIEAGETRTVRCLQAVPVLGELAATPLVADVRIEATDQRDLLHLPEMNVDALRLRTSMRLEGMGTIASRLWCDRAGEVVQTRLDALSQTTIRSTRARALDPAALRAVDLGWDLMVPLAAPLPAPHDADCAVYEVTMPGGDPARRFASGWSQRVERVGQDTARITVCRVRPGWPARPLADQPPPAPRDLAATRLIASDDPRIVAIAQSQAAETDRRWEIAVALEKWVAESVETTDLRDVFATASEVARSGRGDCTEHAVLLAALCRARRIPARLAMGLVYVEPRQAFGYHMWDEVWIEDRWIPLDATLGRGGIGCGHLKLAVAAPEGEGAAAMLLPLLEVAGRISIRAVAVRARAGAKRGGGVGVDGVDEVDGEDEVDEVDRVDTVDSRAGG